MSDPGYLWYNLFGLFYTQGFPMTPAFPDPFIPLAPCLCVRTRYRKRPPGARDAFSESFGTGEGLLRYGIRIRCSKWLPGARDAFSEAFGTGEGLLRYGICVPCSKKASYGTRRIFRSSPCSKQASGVRERYSVPKTPSYGTE